MRVHVSDPAFVYDLLAALKRANYAVRQTGRDTVEVSFPPAAPRRAGAPEPRRLPRRLAGATPGHRRRPPLERARIGQDPAVGEVVYTCQTRRCPVYRSIVARSTSRPSSRWWSRRAAVVRELGVPPALEEVPDPSPAEGEVLVEVLATPLNPVDIAVGAGPLLRRPSRASRSSLETSAWGACSDPGSSSGRTAAGSASGATAGSPSWWPRRGRRSIPSRTEPIRRSRARWGSPGSPAGCRSRGGRRYAKGETVLVLGATGTVGLVAVQGARLLGAGRVVAAGRSEAGLARAAEAGADATVRLDEDDLAAAFREACGGEGPNLVVDPLWGEPLQAAVEACAHRRADRQPGAVGRDRGDAHLRGRAREAARPPRVPYRTRGPGGDRARVPASGRARDRRGRARRHRDRCRSPTSPTRGAASREGAGVKLVVVP